MSQEQNQPSPAAAQPDRRPPFDPSRSTLC
ncbi:hypothetical protein Gogos_016877 [Gossypium gossypioides]|uniref:Uncharacterized protein n=1 Tax=Gossypium gossypioides TaxID=34282 RepID=A0A7J9B901_GOSGO|nr:hypothetical protein [Gossypium gossypioides]